MADLGAGDREEINDLIVRYATAIDSKDWDLLRTCFTDGCSASYGGDGSVAGRAIQLEGRSELVDFMARIHEPLDASLHQMSTTSISFGGEVASARTYVTVILVRSDHIHGPVFKAYGLYEDELTRTTDGWRIASRRYRRIWSEGSSKITE